MSFAIDVDVLLYASNRNCDEHEPVAAFLPNCAPDAKCSAWRGHPLGRRAHATRRQDLAYP